MEKLRIAAPSESAEGEWTPHFQTDLYCPQTRRFPGGEAPWVASAAVLAGVAVSASEAVLAGKPISTGATARQLSVQNTLVWLSC